MKREWCPRSFGGGRTRGRPHFAPGSELPPSTMDWLWLEEKVEIGRMSFGVLRCLKTKIPAWCDIRQQVSLLAFSRDLDNS